MKIEIETKKRAFAGVGNPVKLTDWELSMLNLANLKAAKTGISTTI